MEIPVSITTRGMATSEALYEIAREKLDKMSNILSSDSICKIVLSLPHKHKHVGNEYDISIVISGKGKRIAVKKSGQDAYTSLRRAFDTVFRQLSEQDRK